LTRLLQLVDVVRERIEEKVARAYAFEIDDPHVRDIEHPGVRAHRVVLVDLGAVMNGHVPAAEVDHSSAGCAVAGVEGCLLQQGRLPSANEKGRAVVPPRPVCPFT